jgi:CheY-like chemotaxis protein
MNILVVEDEQEILNLISEILGNKDHVVMTARNGKEALKMIDTLIPDMIITDILMPEMDGYEVLMDLKMKNSETYGSIPVIVVSAMAAPYQIDTAKKFGANAYLTKPFSSEQLFKVIEEVKRG